MRHAVPLLAALLAGCASFDLESPHADHLGSAAVPVRECAEWFVALDAAVAAAGRTDAQETRIAGFPYLRTDRLHAALARELPGFEPPRAEAALQALAERLLRLDGEARRAEISNLPVAALRALPGAPSAVPEAIARSRECARLLRELDLAKPAQRARLLARVRVPDEYSTVARIAGLYPLTRLPFAAGVRRWEARTLAAFDRRAASPPVRLLRFAPPPVPPLPREVLATMTALAAENPLALPELGDRERDWLFAAYAPSFELEWQADHDRFGAAYWPREGDRPRINTAESVVYARLAHTLYEGRRLLQVVYTIFFPERPADGPLDLLAGHIDGLVWRVTIAPDGEPLVYDTIHPCGCYHMFFTTPRAFPRPPPDGFEEWAFTPRELPRLWPGERPLVRLASRSHYVEGVDLVRGTDSLARYELRPEAALRTLVDFAGGGTRSFYGPDGFVPGSERLERFLFWPMGVRSPGTVRQWGRHATAFVGRRHFDDPDLFERRFEFELKP